MVVNGNKLASLVSRWDNFLSCRKSSEGECSSGLGYAGYDLRLSRSFLIPYYYRVTLPDNGSVKFMQRHGLYRVTASPLKPYASYKAVEIQESVNRIILPPSASVLAHSMERIVVPDDCVGICLGKSSYARVGLLVNTTPLEPGWKGHLVIELTNLASWAIELRIGEGIAQVIFLSLLERANYNGRWQDQKLPEVEK